MTRPDTFYDPHNVASFMAGYRVPLTSAEATEVVHILTERGWSVPEIADRLQLNPRSVQRKRSAERPYREPAPAVQARPYPAERFDEREMRHAAARFIASVHDEDPVDVWNSLNDMPPEDVKALAVILAGCCDPDRSITDMLAWVDQLEPGEGTRAA